MATIDTKPCSATDSPCPDCSLFLNWNEGRLKSDGEVAAVFRSLVATLQSHPSLDDSLERKAVTLLKYVSPLNIKSTTAFLHSFASKTDESLSIFIQSIVVLVSSPSQIITTATMRMFDLLITISSVEVRLAIVKADLIPQLINTLNPPSLSFTKAVDIHSSLLHIVTNSFWLASPYCLAQLGIEDRNEPKTVLDVILQQVLAPSGKYICHLCVNHNSIQLKNGPSHSRFVVGWDVLDNADIDVDATGWHPSPLGPDPLLGLACSRRLRCFSHQPVCLQLASFPSLFISTPRPSACRGADRFRRDDGVMARARVRDVKEQCMGDRQKLRIREQGTTDTICDRICSAPHTTHRPGKLSQLGDSNALPVKEMEWMKRSSDRRK
ncbi:hypothetical protein BLNAU_21754 [Blattamonas nauphoetae]|uniref:Uncharacterized protein n=1 Tax=Blattamonas nauphoetae TaxID=2049346 RepID=A0ABQ9WW33_9EUKA|nr:hypothetical protein BLNAU_21754 [Blattamonas nauphoetae]